jgi:hypothetical protein
VCVIPTPSALKFMDTPRLTELTGQPVRYDYKQPRRTRRTATPADAITVAPATFKTIRWAHSASDTPALGILNEAIGLGLPIGLS